MKHYCVKCLNKISATSYMFYGGIKYQTCCNIEYSVTPDGFFVISRTTHNYQLQYYKENHYRILRIEKPWPTMIAIIMNIDFILDLFIETDEKIDDLIQTCLLLS